MVIQGARGLLLTLVGIPAVRNLISVTFPLKKTNLTLGGTCLSSGSLASSSSICCTSEEERQASRSLITGTIKEIYQYLCRI